MKTWRYLGVYIASAAHIHASQEVITRSVGQGKVLPTIRIVIYEPPAVTIGFFQDPLDEVNIEELKKRGIDLMRRPTGGGAVLMLGPSCAVDVPGWEIYVPEDYDVSLRDLDESFRLLSQPLVNYLRNIGIRASFRPKNDIEVGGRKIAGVGQYRDLGGILHTGTLLMDFDVETMCKLLKVTVEKISDKSIRNVSERLTWVRRELGHRPGLGEFEDGFLRVVEEVFDVKTHYQSMIDSEVSEFENTLRKYQSDEWIYGVRLKPQEGLNVIREVKTPAGLIKIQARLVENVIENIMITGDFFMFPQRALYDLEAYLKWSSVDGLEEKVLDFLTSKNVRISNFEPRQLAKLLSGTLLKT